jgi:hypothetical protein
MKLIIFSAAEIGIFVFFSYSVLFVIIIVFCVFLRSPFNCRYNAKIFCGTNNISLVLFLAARQAIPDRNLVRADVMVAPLPFCLCKHILNRMFDHEDHSSV